MMLHGVLFGLLIAGGAVVLSTTRSARLKRMARTLHLRYDKQVDNPLTALSAQTVYLFNRALHQFRQVLTWSEPRMFIRLCQMYVCNPTESVSGTCYTLATAELTRGDFVPFILQPRTQEDKTVHPALPPELATRFTLSAPDHFQFPPQVIGLLKAGPLCYLEASAYALVYHTYSSLPVEQLQPMRLRVQQLARALRHIEEVSPEDTTTFFNTSAADDLQAQTLLKLHAPSSAGGAPSSSNGAKIFYLAFVISCMIALLWGAQYFLRHFIH